MTPRNPVDTLVHPGYFKGMSCPCGGGASLETCCGPYIKGRSRPQTAEALMRSRYSAYTQSEVDYILETHDPDDHEVHRQGAQDWAKDAEWLGLEILETEAGQSGDAEGIVEFVAHYKTEGRALAHHERSTFKAIEGRWYYMDGDVIKKPVVRASPKVGRNDPCTCGSGKKFKKCCGG